MKQGIHPEYKDAKITCGCGVTINTRTTCGDLRVEICSACHPIFTGGARKIIDTEGRVERFRKKYAKT